MRSKNIFSVPSKHFMLLIIQVCLILSTSHTGLSENCECGRSPTSRIRNGYEASNEEFPWMATLYSKKGNEWSLCGASMISTQYAVTAAHCLPEDAEAYYLGFGYPDIGEISKSPPNVEKAVVKSHDGGGQDIGVVKINTPLDVVPICLPGSDNSFAGVNATMLGYGQADKGDERKILRGAEIAIPTDEQCADVQPVASSEICGSIYGGGPAFCAGDSGGPLMYYDNSAGHWILIGVISGGYGCYNTNNYGIFTSVPSWESFIRDNTDNTGCEVTVN